MKKLLILLLLLSISIPSWSATSITKRSEKGSSLTWVEMDANFENLRTGLDNEVANSASAIAAIQAAQAGGTIGFETKADMDADLAHPAGTLALVTNDTTTTNNTYYIKLGGSGSGSWQKSAHPPVLPWYDARNYADFATAVSTISSTPATLVVSTDMSVTTAVSVPSTLKLLFVNGGHLTLTGGGAVTGLTESSPDYFAGNISHAVAALSNGGMLTLPVGTTTATATLAPASNTTITGPAGAILNFAPAAQITYGIDINSLSNVTIRGIKITATSNVVYAVGARGSSAKINILDNVISNPSSATQNGGAIYVASSSDVNVRGNNIDINVATPGTNGYSGIYLSLVSGGHVSNNTVTRARGVYGDGIYTESCDHLTISNNYISDYTRIGIVVEKTGATLSSRINIIGNIIINGHDYTAPESNAGIWIESGASDGSIVINGNNISNPSQTLTGKYLYGLMLNDGVTATGNKIAVTNTGVSGMKYSLVDNDITGNVYGINLTSQTSGLSTNITNNNITDNSLVGILVSLCSGNINITGNYIKDNGSGTTYSYPNYGAGIKINRYYTAQKVVINSNTFVSNMNEGGTTGQVVGIAGITGGDFVITSRYVQNNSFIFTGTFSSAYPTVMDVAPCSFAYDNSSVLTFYEITSTQGNTSTKFAEIQPLNAAPDQFAGNPRFLGYASAAPGSGTYRQGDYYINNNVAASGYFGWICTTGGAPGTWKGYGAIAP